jgi:hypothetical protein
VIYQCLHIVTIFACDFVFDYPEFFNDFISHSHIPPSVLEVYIFRDIHTLPRAANLRVPCSLTVELRCGAAVPCALILLFENINTITILLASTNGAVVRRFGDA